MPTMLKYISDYTNYTAYIYAMREGFPNLVDLQMKIKKKSGNDFLPLATQTPS